LCPEIEIRIADNELGGMHAIVLDKVWIGAKPHSTTMRIKALI